MTVLSPAVSLAERITIAVLVLFGVPVDGAHSGTVVLLVLALGAAAEAVLRWLTRRTSIAAIHRAAELPSQAHVPLDGELLALLRRLGIGQRDLARAWEGCKPSECRKEPDAETLDDLDLGRRDGDDARRDGGPDR
jgi:hypothetical protein